MCFILDHEANIEIISILHVAILRRNYDFIQCVGRLGLEMNEQTSRGNTGLHFAAKLGDLQMIKLLATFNVCLNISNQADETPLHFAIRAGHFTIIQWFISIYPNLQYYFQKENTLCHIASMYNQKNMVEWIDQEGLDVDKANSDGETPLHYAVKAGCIEAINTLLSLKVRLNPSNVYGQAPIHQAAEKDLNILKILYAKGADIYLQDQNGANICHIAAQYGKLDIIKWLEQGLGLKMKWLDQDGDSPIHYAARNGHVKVLEYFDCKGLSMNIPNIAGETPLFLAAFEKHLNVIEYLHEKIGISITEPDKDGDYLVHIAAIEGDVDLLNWLIKKAIDIRVKDAEGQNPLALAIFYQNWHSVRILNHHLMQQDKFELDAEANTGREYKDQTSNNASILNSNIEEDRGIIFITNYSQMVEDMDISGEAVENYNTL